jgi:hypothetical protein
VIRPRLFMASILLVMKIAFAVEASTLMPSRDQGRQALTGPKGVELSTSHRFDPLSLKGKNQKPMGLGVKVEDDKWLDDLLGARSHFEDRRRRDQDRM